MKIDLDFSLVTDRASFHEYFKEKLGFPGYYGKNMDAWIDCMTYIDEPGAGMTTINVKAGEILVLNILNVAGFKQRCPDLYEDLIECSAFVNYRRIEQGYEPVIALSFYL